MKFKYSIITSVFSKEPIKITFIILVILKNTINLTDANETHIQVPHRFHYHFSVSI